MLSKDILNILKDEGEVRHFAKGECVLKKDETTKRVYIVLHGMVTTEAVDKVGKRRSLFSARSGDLVPTGWVGRSTIKVEYDNVAFTGVECVSFTAESFKQMSQKHPDVMFALLQGSDQRIHFAKRRIEMLVQERAEDKVLHLLNYLVKRQGESVDNAHVRVKTGSTQKEIAESLGISRESLSICLRNMLKSGLLKATEGDHLIIHKKKLANSL